MSVNANNERSSRRKSFFDVNEHPVEDEDSLKKLWESKFGPEDMDLVRGIKYPQIYMENLKQKTNQLKDTLATEICLKRSLEKQTNENQVRSDELLVDEGILTTEQRIDLMEIEEKINAVQAQSKEVLDQLKIVEMMQDHEGRANGRIAQIIDGLVESLF